MLINFKWNFSSKKFEHELEILDFEHKYSLVSDKVTVSTGQYFAIPPDEHSLWRFIARAEESLKEIKNETKKKCCFLIRTQLV